MNKGKGPKGKPVAGSGQKLYQGQLPNEANDVYVRRVYSRKEGENDHDYYLRIVSKYSSEAEADYKARIALIQSVLTELSLKDKIIYDDHAKMYIYIQSSTASAGTGGKGHPGQLQNESDETYVRRVYARKTTETERDYYMRITSRYSSETDESYKSRVTLIFNVFSDISQDQIKYDENKKLFMYIQTKQGRKGVVTSTNTKGYPGQQPNEPDDVYVRRVYTKKTEETEEKYIMRVTSRYSTETDEVYKSRVELIINIFSELNIREHIKYDEEKRLYVYIKTTKTDKSKHVDQKSTAVKDSDKKGYPGQLPNEPDDVYVRRVYSKKTEETVETYIMRVTTRYSTETDEIYKSRIQLIITIITEINIQEYIKYDEKKKLYLYLKPSKTDGSKMPGDTTPTKDGQTKLYPNQLPNEPDDVYVKRVYSKKTEETEETYIIRVTTRYSTETDEVYKSRIQLIITVIKEINIQEHIRYDEKKKLYLYVKPSKTDSPKKPGDTKPSKDVEPKGYPGQLPNEPDDVYVRRVYSKKTEETEETYIIRVTTRYSTETDEVYKSRIQLIITIIKEVNIQEHIKYDEKKKLYLYVKPSKNDTPTKPGDITPTKDGKTKPFEGQLPDEPNEVFVRRLYTKKTEETEEKYITRIITRSRTETDEIYKSRVELIITVITDINIKEYIKYDEKKRIYVYVKPSKTQTNTSTSKQTSKTVTQTTETQICKKLYQGQKVNESNEDYVRRVYSRKTNESDQTYYVRILRRYTSESDEDYKSRIVLIITVLNDIKLKDNIVYDETTQQYVYNRPSDSAFSTSTTTTFTSVTTETKQFRSNAKLLPGQKPKESRENYVRRLYSKEADETDDEYNARIISRNNNESDEDYKERVSLILSTFNDQPGNVLVTYDENTRRFVGGQQTQGECTTTVETTSSVTTTTTQMRTNAKLFQGQKQKETDEDYVRRVYSRKPGENDDDYYKRILNRYSNETDEVYKSRVTLILNTLTELTLKDITYDEKARRYVTVKTTKTETTQQTKKTVTKHTTETKEHIPTNTKGYPGQLPNEPDDVYIRRLYTKKTEETEETYIVRITTRQSAETDEVYKSRIHLIITILTEIRELIVYDETKRIYVYTKRSKPETTPENKKGPKGIAPEPKKTIEPTPKGTAQYPGQQPEEPDEVYVRRVYTKKTEETEEQYYLRVTSRYSTETDEVYKSRIELIVKVFNDIPIKDNIKYDQKKKLYAYIIPSKAPSKPAPKDVPKSSKPDKKKGEEPNETPDTKEAKDVKPDKNKVKPDTKEVKGNKTKQTPETKEGKDVSPEKPREKPDTKKNTNTKPNEKPTTKETTELAPEIPITKPTEAPETKEAQDITQDKTKGKPVNKETEPTKPTEEPETKEAKNINTPEKTKGKPDKKKNEPNKAKESVETKEAKNNIPEKSKGKPENKKAEPTKINETPETKEAKDITPEKNKDKPETKETEPGLPSETPETKEAKDITPEKNKGKKDNKKNKPNKTGQTPDSKIAQDITPEKKMEIPESPNSSTKPVETPENKITVGDTPNTLPIQSNETSVTLKSAPTQLSKTPDPTKIEPEKVLEFNQSQPITTVEAPATIENKPSKISETPVTIKTLPAENVEEPEKKETKEITPENAKVIPDREKTAPTKTIEIPDLKKTSDLIPDTSNIKPETKETAPTELRSIPDKKGPLDSLPTSPKVTQEVEEPTLSKLSAAPETKEPVAAKTQLYPNQLPNEPDEVYVRRLYTKKTDETEEQYYLRITSKYSTETEEVYKSRVQLIINIFRELNINKYVTYDDKKQLYAYIQPSKPETEPKKEVPQNETPHTKKANEITPTDTKVNPGQLPNEPNEVYVRRVYTKKPEETEEDYLKRVTTRYSTETDESYITRISLIIRTITEVNITEQIRYDEVKKLYMYVQKPKTDTAIPTTKEVNPGQLPNEPNEVYVRRVYTKKPEETEEDYLKRVTTRYSTETDESYITRITLIIRTITEVNITEQIRYDEVKKLYLYVQKPKTAVPTSKEVNPGQLPNEPNDVYVRRVYTKKPEETEEDYLKRVTTRYSTETDESYVTRIKLIIQIVTEVNITEQIRYDEVKKLYLYVQKPKTALTTNKEANPGQLPNEPNDVYVRRVYTKKPEETEEDYLKRVTTRYSTETDESYITRIKLIMQIITEVNITEQIRYDEVKKLYLYVQKPKTDSPFPSNKEGFPGQLPNEPNDVYVRRVYTKKTEETEETYIIRVTTRYSIETDEVYKSRIKLIITTIKEVNIQEHIKYDEVKKLYVYVKPVKTDGPKKPDETTVTTPTNDGKNKPYPGQLPNEPDEVYVRRVYTKKTEESEDTYILRITSRYSTETDEVYKSRIQLIITIIKEINIQEYIRYDENKKIYVYVKPAKTDSPKKPNDTKVPTPINDSNTKPYPGQLPNEPNDVYVRRLYTRKTEETEETYILRITTRQSTETDEVYKSRIQLIITIFIEIKELIVYDEIKRIYVYKKTSIKDTPSIVKLYPGQLPNEPDDVYVRRMYTRKTGENEETYIKRITSRQTIEADEVYKSRIQLIITIFIEIKELIEYDETKRLYIYKKTAITNTKGYPGQLPNEPDDVYVRRVYTRKTEETDDKYILRVTSRYSTETDEVYKSRIQLIITIFTEIKEHIVYDETKRLYVYKKKSIVNTKGYPGQLPNEPDEVYVRRVYTRKTDETEDKYIMRLTSRYSTETDEVYKSRIQLIVTIFSELKIMEHITYDENKRLYIYRRASKPASDSKLYHCQQPGESNEVYVRRVYAKGANESERDYYLRITSRSSTETDEKYKARIDLIQSILTDLPLKEKIIYDDHAKLYIYVQSAKEAKQNSSASNLFPGQKENEQNDAYAKRVYGKLPNESEMDYYLRFTSRYSSESDDEYKARIDLIVNTFKDQNLQDNMSYDEGSGLYIYMQPL